MDITSAIFDPELGCTAFTVERITYTRGRTGTTSRSVTAQAMGCIHPGTPEMIQLLPEEEKNEQFIAVYTDYACSLWRFESVPPLWWGVLLSCGFLLTFYVGILCRYYTPLSIDEVAFYPEGRTLQ